MIINMKFLAYSAALALGLSLVSCDIPNQSNSTTNSQQTVEVKTGSVKTENHKNVKVDKFSYDDHDYILFSRGSRIEVVHDPNCKCQQQ